jgi:hypothetical protein
MPRSFAIFSRSFDMSFSYQASVISVRLAPFRLAADKS